MRCCKEYCAVVKHCGNRLARRCESKKGAEAADPDHNRPGRLSGITLGPVAVQRAVLAEVRPDWDTRHLLTKLAEHAQRFDIAVLLTIDELHSGDRDELRRLSADIQHITKRAHWPLAVVAGGLSEMKHTSLMDKKMTFCQQAFLGAVAEAGGQAGPEQLGATLPYSFVNLADTERRLLACGYLATTDDGALRLTELMPAHMVQSFTESSLHYQDPQTAITAPELSSTPSARCGEYMPRAKAHCILPDSHNGPHRSGKRRRN